MTEDNLCPSCGMVKEDIFRDKPLCFYCFFRGQHITMRFVILKILAKSDKKLSVKELLKRLNTLKCIGYPMRKEDLKVNLLRLKNYRFIRPAKSNTYRRRGGRQKLRYSITKRGRRNLAALSKRWEQGFVMRYNKKSELRMKNFRMTTDKRERAAAIRGKILNKEYDKYKFILTNRKYKKKFGMLNPPKYKCTAERKHKIFRWDNIPGIDTEKLITFLRKIYPDFPDNPTFQKSKEYESIKISYLPDKYITISISTNIDRRKFMIVSTGYRDKFCRCVVHKLKNRKHYYIYSRKQPEMFEWNPHIKYKTIKIERRKDNAQLLLPLNI